MVPQLTRIDSKDLSPSDRIKANQSMHKNIQLLEEFVYDLQINPPKDKKFSKEDRKQMYKEECEQKERDLKKEKNKQKPQFEYERKKKENPKYKYDGERRMCNEFKCNWTLEEYQYAEYSELRLDLPKYLEISEINVELTGKWIAVDARNDLFQMKLWEEVYSNPVKLQRSAITGQLYIQMRKIKIDPLLKRKQDLEKEQQIQKLKKEKEEKERKEIESKKEKEFREKQIKKVYGGFIDCDKDDISYDEDDLEDLDELSVKSLESMD